MAYFFPDSDEIMRIGDQFGLSLNAGDFCLRWRYTMAVALT